MSNTNVRLQIDRKTTVIVNNQYALDKWLQKYPNATIESAGPMEGLRIGRGKVKAREMLRALSVGDQYETPALDPKQINKLRASVISFSRFNNTEYLFLRTNKTGLSTIKIKRTR